jgi:beta-glucosidase
MDIEKRVDGLMSQMTLEEKVGQLCQATDVNDRHLELARQGRLGSILNVVGPETANPAQASNEAQRAAVEGSRFGIPLIFGRDVIHGYRTILPIPLGQAASFDPALVEEGAAVAAREASAAGIHWTFGPMVDIARDPRWGRIAEGGGEDPVLASRMGAAMVRGFQGSDPSHPERIAACAKHYAGYGAAEGGRDYNTTWIPENLLRDVYLPSFKACVEAGVATVMSAFNDLNGLPATANPFLLRQVLRDEWGFDGFVVSDWDSVQELIPQGVAANKTEATRLALAAGVDMEMVSTCYAESLRAMVESGAVPVAQLDEAVRRVLRTKLRLGLFDRPYVDESRVSILLADSHREVARRLATESCVLLKNDGALPLPSDIRSLACIGPLADAPVDQLGCWAFDGRAEDSVTPLTALKEALAGRCEVTYAAGLDHARGSETKGFAEARRLAAKADAVVLFLGEDAGLSGEAHCRAFLDLPGAQEQLVRAVAEVGKPVICVVMTGRPLALTGILDKANALLVAWHPGTMGGPAIADLLLGKASPSGKLPASFPRTVGQVPIYHSHMNTGRPPSPGMADIPTGTPLDPTGFLSGYLDVAPVPLFPFGYGLSYTRFAYSDLKLSRDSMPVDGKLTASVEVANTGPVAGEEVVQLYLRDLVGSLTRPVKELKDFARILLAPGESRTVSFTLNADQLAFHTLEGKRVVEPGAFHLMIGGNSRELLTAGFDVQG